MVEAAGLPYACERLLGADCVDLVGRETVELRGAISLWPAAGLMDSKLS
jgi:hypothetical protein